MERIFFNWDHQFLPQVVNYLISRYQIENHLDMSRAMLVFSGSRALRRLEKLLIQRIQLLIDEQIINPDWIPPIFLTVGHFPEHLYQLKRPLAQPIAQQFAWIKAIREIGQNNLKEYEKIFGFNTQDDLKSQLELSRIFQVLHNELASDGKSFENVIESLRQKNIPAEIHRWELLKKLEDTYFNLLDQSGIWDKQAARIFAVKHQECQTENDIILVGTSDLNRIQKMMLEEVSDRVSALVFASDEEQDGFDPFGCIVPEYWQNKKFPITREQIIQAANPQEQAIHIVDILCRQAGLSANNNTSADIDWSKFSIGTPDGEIVPFLEQRLTARGIPVSYAAGVSSAQIPNRVIQLVKQISDFLGKRLFSSFTGLIRHPDFERYLLRKLTGSSQGAGNWLGSFDRYQNNYLPELADEHWNLREVEKSNIDVHLLSLVIEAVEDLLNPFRADNDTSLLQEQLVYKKNDSDPTSPPLSKENFELNKPEQIGKILQAIPEIRRILNEKQLTVRQWCPIISELICKIYPEDDQYQTNKDEIFQIEQGIAALNSSLSELANIPEAFSQKTGASFVFSLLDRLLQSTQLQSRPHQDGLELVGWLDLLLDDSPNIIISGMNEGIIPSTISDDLFLPDTLRRSLDLNDNRRRLARDNYEFSAIIHSHPDLNLVFGKRSVANDPLMPSRFLFAADAEEMAVRVCHFFNSAETVIPANNPTDLPPGNPNTVSRQSGVSRFHPPVLHLNVPCPTSMAVTEFKDFLACPYRYFLKHHFNLRHLSDNSLEMSIASFGSIIHHLLQTFGEDTDLQKITDSETLYLALSDMLDKQILGIYQNEASPMIPIQKEQIRSRLKEFAQWQVQWRQLGNEILFVEKTPQSEVALNVDGEKMNLRGRIDRIDYNPALNAWFVWDIKTYDSYKTGTKNAQNESLLPEKFAKLFSSGVGNTPDGDHRINIGKPSSSGKKVLEKHLDESRKSTKKESRWKNLQLPLYRYLFSQILADEKNFPDPDSVHFGYIVLPKSGKVHGLGCPWSLQELAEADETGRWVIRTVRRLWREGVNPDCLIDTNQPDRGYILASSSPVLSKEWAPITCENQIID